MKDRLVKELGHRFIILAEIGRGAFSRVFECINLFSHKTVALKVIKKYRQSPKQLLLSIQEAKILEKLNHPNIVRFFALHQTDSFLALEMENLKEKSLHELLATNRLLTEEEASLIMKSIFAGVSYLHKVHIIHRDLKPENIVFANKDLNSLKIADFGLSVEFHTGEVLNSQAGTIIYMAPEVINHFNYSESADIWSCGIILYKVLSNSHPLFISGDTSSSYIAKIQRNHWEIPESFTALAKDLFLRCVNSNPIERYSANLALKHPWITRNECKIPATHIEQIRMHQDSLKIKTIFRALLSLVTLSATSKPIQHRMHIDLEHCEKTIESEFSPNEIKIRAINKFFKRSERPRNKRFTGKILRREIHENLAGDTRGVSLKITKSGALVNKNMYYKLKLVAPLTKQILPLSADR